MRQDHQLIIVYPDLVTRLEQRDELLREKLVHLYIGVEIVAFEGGEIVKIVEQRPENRVGKAVVVIVIQVFINENGQYPKILAGGMGGDGLVPVLLGKIRYTHPHFLRYIPPLCRPVLEIALYRGDQSTGALSQAYLIPILIQGEG